MHSKAYERVAASEHVDGEVSEADLHAMLEAAFWAPHHKMIEPWRVTVLRRSRECRRFLA